MKRSYEIEGQSTLGYGRLRSRRVQKPLLSSSTTYVHIGRCERIQSVETRSDSELFATFGTLRNGNGKGGESIYGGYFKENVVFCKMKR
ncbi:hypothetical protein AV530_008855 [Patagioenas fasciata monilis]|uniref:Uncharacterized protein n=1 Tax=Patagioenas fasciata monilis TaxID=372326 RepID=A0A1V4L0C1_PATFA|nr:hypothetical protein AV530_008855 [Patagioenas fasciata monilis]